MKSLVVAKEPMEQLEFMTLNGMGEIKGIQWIKQKESKGFINGVLMEFNGIPSGVERNNMIQLNSIMVGRNQLYSMEYNHRNGRSQ